MFIALKVYKTMSSEVVYSHSRENRCCRFSKWKRLCWFYHRW